MKRTVKKFPRVHSFDITYNTNNRNLKLFVGQVIDGYGRGRVSCYCIIVREKAEYLKACLQIYVKVNTPYIQFATTVLIDKDFSELCAIVEILHWVLVNICKYHVKKTFREKCNKLPDTLDQTHIKNILYKMVEYADTEAKYMTYYEELMSISDSDFMKYFDENWHRYANMWTPWGRVLSITYGVDTTNPTESHNGQIKTVVNRSSTLVELLRGLMLLYRQRDFRISYQQFRLTKLRTYLSGKDDPEQEHLMSVVTPFASKLLNEARAEATSLTIVQCEKYNATVTTCDCIKFRSLLLTCSHVIFMRRLYDHTDVDIDCIDQHWKIEYQDDPICPDDNISNCAQSDAEMESEEDVGPPISPPIPSRVKCRRNIRSTERKYNDSMRTCKDICNLIQYMTEGDALKWELVLNKIYDCMGRNVLVEVVPKDGKKKKGEKKNI